MADQGLDKCLREASSGIEDFFQALELSRPCNQPCSESLIEALRNSWTSICTIQSEPPVRRESEQLYTSSCLASERNTLLPTIEYSDSSKFWAQIALDYSWEQLHIGPWHDVSLFWRQTYSLAAVLYACNLALKNEHQVALLSIDKGILMGAPIVNNLLHKLASQLHTLLKLSVGPEDAGRCDTKRIGKVKFRNYSPEDVPSGKKIKCAPSLEDDSKKKNVPLVDMARRIATVQCPTLEEFYDQFMHQSRPVVLTGAMDHWPSYAEQKWRLVPGWRY